MIIFLMNTMGDLYHGIRWIISELLDMIGKIIYNMVIYPFIFLDHDYIPFEIRWIIDDYI